MQQLYGHLSFTEGYRGIRECTKVCTQNDLSCMGYGLPGVNWHLFLTNIRVVMRLCLLYQILNGYIYFNQNTFTPSTSLSHHLLHSMTLSHPFCRKKYSFVPFTINLWNNLEHTILSAPTPSCFKYRLVHSCNSCNSCLVLAIICYVHVFLSFMTNYYIKKNARYQSFPKKDSFPQNYWQFHRPDPVCLLDLIQILSRPL